MAETDREQVVSLLRACIGSMKGGVPMRNLNCKLNIRYQTAFLSSFFRPERLDFYCLVQSHSFCRLSHDRSVACSKVSSPESVT